ncbi:phosphoribosylamine--glycine ligase [Alicyclobacillus dauci]|uniref:Phosphoribosylamine--glycine ligase n=1 Tax=Alicyclobacillus dauci TaxID=1475485 RepID=A0ABY6Z2X5_9BACL|nr:phosphoribosylamine--glycine ligase [Alicyclobacillus dauci]WAH36644.1 phosphoribosylamine--glycine ligase [Alicyclobacillus dauci]
MQQLKQHPRVAIIGSGAREHAITWKLSQSPLHPVLYTVPGNPGMWDLAAKVDVSPSDHAQFITWAQHESIDFIVVGPEQPLAEGLVDALAAVDIPAFGPSAAAAQLESSKAYSKSVMKEADVPTAKFEAFTDASKAMSYVRTLAFPVVIKADGLAAGKGVVIVDTEDQADATIRDMLEGNRFGASGHKVVIEEFLVGEEVSLMYFVDRDTVVPMLPARDFKRVGEGDQGPNTGGMGAFCPVPVFLERNWTPYVTDKIVRPTLQALNKQGITYRGVLYVGLMITHDGPKVIEFNARFGDPETEVVLPLLSSDLLEIMWATAHDELSAVNVKWQDAASVCVVLAGGEYPAKSDHGTPIQLSTETPEDIRLFHAGTTIENGQLVTAGGRVITVSAVGQDIPSAVKWVYANITQAHFAEMQYRRDIAHNWQR